jgi:SAM-dependent methyltransferase
LARLVIGALRRFERPVAWLAVRICRQATLEQTAFAFFEYPKIRREYGDFRLDEEYGDLHIRGLAKESGTIRGAIVSAIGRTAGKVTNLLLPGEYNRDKRFYSELFGIDQSSIVTAGVGGDMDFDWNYEYDSPEIGKFDYIISQAMLEHLIDPYKHVGDLYNLMNPGGHMILHTHIPGFAYHRHPIDCVRFFPDWFEAVADRLGLEVVDRFIGDLRICYTYRKPN